jgi:hypothetical protein|nr:MAG TPA: hypothetical protein [Caudoviricetes sp.]
MKESKFDVKNLFNSYDNLDIDHPLSDKREVYIYGETGKYDEILQNYIEMKRKKISVVFHYLLYSNQSILSEFEATEYINHSYLSENEANFDIPTFAALTGIKIIGITADELDTGHGIVNRALFKALDINERKVAIILPQHILDSPNIREFIEKTIPYAVIKDSKYVMSM